MLKFILVGLLLLWIWGGALGMLAAMWIPICLFFLFLTWVFGLDFRITLLVFAVVIGLQLMKGNELLGISQKLEDQPTYFVTPLGEYELSLNNQNWYSNPRQASYSWLKMRLASTNLAEAHPSLHKFLKENNMTRDELLEIGKQNTRQWYKDHYHADEPDYVVPF